MWKLGAETSFAASWVYLSFTVKLVNGLEHHFQLTVRTIKFKSRILSYLLVKIYCGKYVTKNLLLSKFYNKFIFLLALAVEGCGIWK